MQNESAKVVKTSILNKNSTLYIFIINQMPVFELVSKFKQSQFANFLLANTRFLMYFELRGKRFSNFVVIPLMKTKQMIL